MNIIKYEFNLRNMFIWLFLIISRLEMFIEMF